jgi:pre-mRNA-splicing factor CDC5/CEF1
MVRVFLKGGVWKNSEDEILKAAVQKYGKQQWARVASLLNRKTAKQAKARWHEWLDPAVKKTEWSAAEEEKLLQAAKLMPAQWKTIAPIVGRTAAQCQEHYEYLLDQAATEEGTTAGGTTGGASAAVLRQQQSLRPGQIDAAPETKPAKPDPVDMDEDELEMLQEARARLANTVGKKAKRKQRERMLLQAKRLADLQKRRELKQAGLLSSKAAKKSRKRKQEIDLGVEIPFHKPAPAGFHDVSTEDARAEAVRIQRWKEVDYKKINEQQYRTRDREAARAAKREEQRLKILEQSNEKYAQQKKDIDEDVPARPRGMLKLPAPTVTDSELTELAKLQRQHTEEQSGSVGGTGVTEALLGDYSDRPLPTPMRTPATPGGRGKMMQQASALRELERGATPLLPGTVPADEEEEEGSTHAAAISVSAATPQPPDRLGSGRTTPGSFVAPLDQLGLNMGMDDAASIGGSTFATSTSIRELARQERRAAKRARQELEAALAALPTPQYEYELQAPAAEVTDNDEELKVESIEDRADVEAREQEKLRKEAEKLHQARSSVIKRKDLPRPANTKVFPEAEGQALGLIQTELLTLLEYDAVAFPVVPTEYEDPKKSKKKRQRKQSAPSAAIEAPSLEHIHQELLDAAKTMIQNEFTSLLEEKIGTVLADGKAANREEALTFLAEENARVAEESASTMVYLEGGGWSEAKSDRERNDSLRLELETLQEVTAAIKKKNDKLESRLSVMNGGYIKRGEKLRSEILQSISDLEKANIEEAVYRQLLSQEVAGGTNRVNRLKKEILELKKQEAALQKRYGDLVVEKRRLQVTGKRKAWEK